MAASQGQEAAPSNLDDSITEAIAFLWNIVQDPNVQTNLLEDFPPVIFEDILVGFGIDGEAGSHVPLAAE
jgi:hypothetical protein